MLIFLRADISLQYHETAMCYARNMTENLQEDLAEVSDTEQEDLKHLACQMLELLGEEP